MAERNEYKTIFEREIIQKSKGVIFSYSPVEDKYKFQPYSHSTEDTAVENLGELMRHNLLFYAFGEDEVVAYYKKDCFSTLEQAAKFAYKQRLPKRDGANDGLPSEVLLDLLIQLYNPNAYKLAVRTLFRQNDNNEIKGYDLVYFTKDEANITLWLGQAKLGEKNYCKKSIDDDLSKKYEGVYLAKQLYFVCDKRVNITKDAAELLDLIEKLNIQMSNDNDEDRAKGLLELFKQERIKIKIPCLLAYDADAVYDNPCHLYEQIETEVLSMRDYYHRKNYAFSGFAPEIIFYIFPIESVNRLRNKEKGFYAGLCQTTSQCN